MQVIMVRAVHPHVDEICSSAQHARQVRAAHHAIRGLVVCQQRESLLAVPAVMPELDRHPNPVGNQPEEIRQPGVIARQLDQ